MLRQAHVPILNVRYDNDRCGPYRDWQWEEGWLQADGDDVAPGFRRCPTPARTILDSEEDGGNFPGVALYSEGDETVLVSEMEAEWYRYVSQWRLHRDGTIRPRFGFAAVAKPLRLQRASPPRLLAIRLRHRHPRPPTASANSTTLPSPARRSRGTRCALKRDGRRTPAAAAHFTHDVHAETGDGVGHIVGPDLTPTNWDAN